MSHTSRSLVAMAVTPLLAATLFTSTPASAWLIGAENIRYTRTDAGWVTTAGPASHQVSGTDWISHRTWVCNTHAFEYKRYRTLLPTQVLISNGFTTSPTCGWRTRSRSLGDLGTLTVFGNFRAKSTAIADTWIEG